jgi:hypothetical protein
MSTSSKPSRLAFLALLILSSSGAAVAQAAAAAAPPAAAPPPPSGFAMNTLRPALANVQNTISNLNVSHWKASSQTRDAVTADIASMQRDLNATLPGLVTQADSAGPNVLGPTFAVFRNLDALYDVLLRVTETAALAGTGADPSSLEDARAGLEDARGKLGAWLLQSIGSQDTQVAHLQAQIAAKPAAAPPPPNKIVVEDGPDTTTKPHKKKPAPTTTPQ